MSKKSATKSSSATKAKEPAMKEVAKAKTHDVALPIDPSQMFADAGMGMEEADSQSFAIPFVALLQGLSPQLETVEGARPGLFLDTVTNELSSELIVVPAAFQRRYLRWAPRAAGGGFKGSFTPLEVESGALPNAQRGEDGRWTIDGDELKDTRIHFVMKQSAETGVWSPAVISLTSTQIKKSKTWMARIDSIRMKAQDGSLRKVPPFSHSYRLTAQKEENAKGSWWGYGIELIGPVEDAEVYHAAKDLCSKVVSGVATTAEPPEEASEPEAKSGF